MLCRKTNVRITVEGWKNTECFYAYLYVSGFSFVRSNHVHTDNGSRRVFRYGDIWRTNQINSLLCRFEWPYLWRNYRTNLRRSILNTFLWSKLFWNKYVRKNTFRTEERTEWAWYIIENNSKNQKQSFLWELLFQKLQNVTRFWYIVRVLWEEREILEIHLKI